MKRITRVDIEAITVSYEQSFTATQLQRYLNEKANDHLKRLIKYPERLLGSPAVRVDIITSTLLPANQHNIYVHYVTVALEVEDNVQ